MNNRNIYSWSRSLKKILLKLWPYLLALLVFLTIRLAIRKPEEVEHLYSRGIYPFIAKNLSAFSGLFPFSLWDIFWLLFILMTISGLTLAIFRRIKFSWYFLRYTQLLALLYSLFYIVWGFNYFRPDIETRLDWKKPVPDEEVFRAILDSIIIKTNRNYISVSSSDYSVINRLEEESYRSNSTDLGINYPNGSRRPKTMLFSSFFLKLGVSGYFGPFFNEIQVNHFLLPMEYPYLLAHEKAHQFGITSEAEANLLAYIICIKSPDQRLRYSGYVFLMLYFLRDATRLEDYKDYLKKIDKPVLQDIQYRQKYYDALQNETLGKMQTAANNAYLKANHIEKGVMNYNQVVALTISWYQNIKTP